MKEEKQTIYALWILRKDQEHISVIETTKFDEVFELYNEIKNKWTLCIKDQTPFELLKPIVTSFDPGLIYEITIRPITETSSTKYENPYQQQMLKNGLSNMFKPSSDLLDGGYK
jgi:hypothetical protein